MKRKRLLQIAAMVMAVAMIASPTVTLAKSNGYKWSNSTTDVFFWVTGDTAIISNAERQCIANAFQTWNRVNYSYSNMYHKYFFTTTNTNSPGVVCKPLVWDKGPGAVGYTSFVTSNGYIQSVTISLNEVHYDFATGAVSGKYDIQSIVAHEAGHALGIAHCHEIGSSCSSKTCSSNCMNPSAVINSTQRRTLQPYDSASFHMIYLKS